MEETFKIWRTNSFNNELLEECVGELYDLELAKELVSHQATLGNSYAITKNGVRIECE